MLAKGLARAGINNFDHQRLIATAVQQLGMQSPEELQEDMDSKEEARTGSKPAWMHTGAPPVAPKKPRPDGNSFRGRKFQVPVIPRLPDPLPPSDYRYNAEQEEELSRRSRTTPRPYTEDPADGTQPPLSDRAVGCVRRFRESVATSAREYEAMVFIPGPAPARASKVQRMQSGNLRDPDAAVGKVRSLQQLQAQGGDFEDEEQMCRAQEEAAALRIQAIRRGAVARRQRTEQAALQAQEPRRRASDKDKDSSYLQHIHYADEGDEVAQDLIFEEQRELRQHAAAAQLQALYRGNMARSNYRERKLEQERHRMELEDAASKMEEDSERRRMAEEQVREEDLPPLEGTEEEQAAAVRIQAIQRGKQARREVEAMLTEQEQSNQKDAGEVGEDELPPEGSAEEEAAAVRIQAVWHGKQARRTVEGMIIEQEEEREQEMQTVAATKIQSIFRGNQARRTAEDLLIEQEGQAAEEGGEEPPMQEEQGQELESAEEGQQTAEEAAAEEAAATRIQAIYRGSTARREVEAMLHEDSAQLYGEDSLQTGGSGEGDPE